MYSQPLALHTELVSFAHGINNTAVDAAMLIYLPVLPGSKDEAGFIAPTCSQILMPAEGPLVPQQIA